MSGVASRVNAPHLPADTQEAFARAAPPRAPRAPRTSWARVLATVRRLIGVPDYEAYYRHVAACHPDREPLTENEFLEERLQAKYSRPGQRCC